MSIQQEFIDSLRRWKNDELKDVLATNHLSVKGNKTEMVLRLQQFYREKFANDNTTPLDNSQHDGTSSAAAIPTTISLTPQGYDGGTTSSSQSTNNPTDLSAIPTYSNQNLAMHMGYTINTPAVPYSIYTPQTPSTSVNTNTATPTYTSGIGPPPPRHYPHRTAPSWQGPPNFATTHHHMVNNNIAKQAELESLQIELRILKTREEIRNTQYRLSQPPVCILHSTQLDANNSVLQLVKRSVDINSLPPSKPNVFSGNVMEYHKWKSMFDLLVESKDLHPSQKLIYLEQYLSDEALDCIKGLHTLNTTDAYDEARRILDERFGDPYDVANAYREQLESWPKIGADDNKGLRKYADFLRQCVIATHSIRELTKLSDPRVMKCFPNALPESILEKWSRVAGAYKLENKQHLSFADYAEFVKKEAYLANDTTTSKTAIRGATTRRHNTQPKPTFTHATYINSEESTQTSMNRSPTRRRTFTLICHHCQSFAQHNTADCDKVAALNSHELATLIERENLCSNCLRRGHESQNCYTKMSCKTCGQNHASCLHNVNKTGQSV